MNFIVKSKVSKWWFPLTSTTFMIPRYPDQLFRHIHIFGTPGIKKFENRTFLSLIITEIPMTHIIYGFSHEKY